MSMIPHIVRKDWKLLWPLVVAGAALQALLAFLEYRPESFAAGGGSNAAATILSLSLGIALILTILLIVQQDALPGVNQDWLVRPIKRHDLLVAKAVFVILAVHGPILVVHCVRGVAEGLGLGEMLRATLLSNLELALLFSLPVLALGALTKTVTEALVTALAALLFTLLAALCVATIAMTVSQQFHLGGETDDSGVEWIVGFLHHAVLILTAFVVVGVQYFRRDTRSARIVLALGLLLFVIVGRLPWRPAFALQEALSAEPEAARAVSLSFAPGARGLPGAAGAVGAVMPSDGFALQAYDAKARQRPVETGRQRLMFDVEVQGLPPGSSLHADRVALRLVDEAGNTVYRGTAQNWDLRTAGDGTARARQVVDLSKKVYMRLADRGVNIELDYSLTLLTPRILPALPALDGNAWLDGIGRCASHLDDDGNGIDVGCDAAGELPPCLSVSLARGSSDQLGPETFVCDLDYAPVAWRFSVEPIDRFVRKLPLKDLVQASGSSNENPEVGGMTIVIRVYDAVAHFSRHITRNKAYLRDFASPPVRP